MKLGKDSKQYYSWLSRGPALG